MNVVDDLLFGNKLFFLSSFHFFHSRELYDTGSA